MAPRMWLAPLLILSLGACPMDNPAFVGESEASGPATGASATTSVDTTTGDPTATATTTTSGGTSATTAATTTATTTATSTATEPTTTGVTTGTSETTGVTASTSSSSGGSSTSEGDTDVINCLIPETIQLFALRDAFFTTGTFQGCALAEQDPDLPTPCNGRNFGATTKMLLRINDKENESMYALEFDVTDAQKEIEGANGTLLEARLVLNLYGTSQALTLGVGKIPSTDPWFAGKGNGTLAEPGEATYLSRSTGDPQATWTNLDGPRGASEPLCTHVIPADTKFLGYEALCVFDVGPWFFDKMSPKGLVVYLDPETPASTLGPGIHAIEAGDAFAPIIEIDYCPG